LDTGNELLLLLVSSMRAAVLLLVKLSYEQCLLDPLAAATGGRLQLVAFGTVISMKKTTGLEKKRKFKGSI